MEVTSVTLDQATASVEVGKTVKVTATVVPADATDKTVTYSIDDDTIATVTADGTITGVKAGSATVTVTAGDKTATTAVTVTDAA
ncbi:MAG TPA: Ig-like domain-containing protein [Candidatus Levilactobacillus faecigallinarum]|uniref:Ig-like domain-containing protein n=1 Tax=Candidatus Levilactobacillus faecigallinarum TaxID=2838638 RepID=A0A9D1U5N5_9LACO|nr:Ig-like domain-containing protein [Candidatus Levilactobacillus faecigallinarum]